MCGRYYISEETYQDLQRIVALVEQNIKKKIQTGDIRSCMERAGKALPDRKNLGVSRLAEKRHHF